MRIILTVLCWLMASSAYAQDIFNPASGAQLPGTTTNDNANAGNVGQFLASNCPGNTVTATVTITIAAPGVISWASHPFVNTAVNIDACPVVFTTSGALPTGITSGTTYYVVPSTIVAATSFQIATSVANALAGTAITTSGTQSGTQTGTSSAGLSTGSPKDLTGLSLTAGDWDVSGLCAEAANAATTSTSLICNVVTTSGTLNTVPGDANAFATDAATTGAGGNNVLPTNTGRFSLSGTTTLFLDVQSTFATNSMNAYGTIRARRVR